MSKQALGEIIKAASLIATAVIYLFLISALITQGRASASIGVFNGEPVGNCSPGADGVRGHSSLA